MSEKPSFRERQFAVREDAILDAANNLMAQKGFDLMSMDDIAAEVGIAKGSLYKHFESKEALAAATMTRLLRRTIVYAQGLPATMSPLARLRELLAWCLRERLHGGVPHLPSTSKALQAGLLGNAAYVAAVTELNASLQSWVEQARRAGELREDLPDEAILYTVYARTCDPSLEFLLMAGKWSEDEIVDLMVRGCFEGLAVGTAAGARGAAASPAVPARPAEPEGAAASAHAAAKRPAPARARRAR
jgi:AcrR family transcriptional regulator